jgi:hypothetical protein
MSSQLCQNCYDVLSEYEEGRDMIIERKAVHFQPYGCVICAEINRGFHSRSSDVSGPLSLSRMKYWIKTITPNAASLFAMCSTADGFSDSSYTIMPLDSRYQLDRNLKNLLTLSRWCAPLDTTHFSQHTISRCYIISKIKIEGMP